MQNETLLDVKHIVDGISKHLRSLKTLGQPFENWVTVKVHLIKKKLEPLTHKE